MLYSRLLGFEEGQSRIKRFQADYLPEEGCVGDTEERMAYLMFIDDLQDRTSARMSPWDWVVKEGNRWVGFDPEIGDYLQEPIRFDADLQFEKYYEALIISDKESGSCNLIWSIKKLIKEGGDNGLSDKNWISLWLQFSKKYM